MLLRSLHILAVLVASAAAFAPARERRRSMPRAGETQSLRRPPLTQSLRRPPRTSLCMSAGTPALSREAKLALSIVIDLIGVSTYAVPAVGEAGDLAWAPISAALIYYMYGNGLYAGLGFAEEIFPGLDFVPTATIAWFLTQTGETGERLDASVNRDRPPAPQKKADLRDGAIDV
mmetsp:Transcript_11893/g.35454  ORF Transcript_11893/g.35454 Transcript_11893/m.35454 type:complete len:175 (+) Transcript_11893:236-760(+)